jgi:hypothetical protein
MDRFSNEPGFGVSSSIPRPSAGEKLQGKTTRRRSKASAAVGAAESGNRRVSSRSRSEPSAEETPEGLVPKPSLTEKEQKAVDDAVDGIKKTILEAIEEKRNMEAKKIDQRAEQQSNSRTSMQRKPKMGDSIHIAPGTDAESSLLDDTKTVSGGRRRRRGESRRRAEPALEQSDSDLMPPPPPLPLLSDIAALDLGNTTRTTLSSRE